MRIFDVEKLRLSGVEASAGIDKRSGVPRPKPGEHFLKGPVPLPWIACAGRRKGKAMHVGVYVWYKAGLTRSRSVQLSPAELDEMGVDRFAVYRALEELESAGLVTVKRRTGRKAIVTIEEYGAEPGSPAEVA